MSSWTEKNMLKRFLAGSAVAALTLSAGAAAAQDFKVTISGDFEFMAAAGSQKKDSNTRSVDFRNRFRLWINPEAVGLNGQLTYGAKTRLKVESSNSSSTSDRAFVYAKGAFGTVSAGENTTYNDDIGAVTAPNDWRPETDTALAFVGSSQEAYSGTSANGLSAWRWDTLDSTGSNNTLRYETPYISGVQLGIAYTPSADNIRDTGNTTTWSFNRSKGGLTDAYEVGIRFDSTDKTIADKFGGVALKASADYQGGTIRSQSSSLTKLEDLQAFQGGLSVGYAGFTVGGGIVYYGTSGLSKTDVKQTDAYTWRVGAQYQTGPWAMGVSYDNSVKDVDFDTLGTTSNGGSKKAQQYSTGVGYNVAKGLDLSLEYDYVKTRNTFADVKDDANVVVLSTHLSF
jgi:outer membrane protein OmpU